MYIIYIFQQRSLLSRAHIRPGTAVSPAKAARTPFSERQICIINRNASCSVVGHASCKIVVNIPTYTPQNTVTKTGHNVDGSAVWFCVHSSTGLRLLKQYDRQHIHVQTCTSTLRGHFSVYDSRVGTNVLYGQFGAAVQNIFKSQVRVYVFMLISYGFYYPFIKQINTKNNLQ